MRITFLSLYFLSLTYANAQTKGFTISCNLGVSSAGNFQDGLFVFYKSNPGFLGLNYIPKPGVDAGVYKEILKSVKSKLEIGINVYYSSLKLEYQIISSSTPKKFETFTSSSNMRFSFIGPSIHYSHQIKESKWNYDAGLDLKILGIAKLTEPEFDSLAYLDITMPNGKPLISGMLAMPSFGVSYSIKKWDIGIQLYQSVNTLLKIDVFPRKRLTFLGAKVRFHL